MSLPNSYVTFFPVIFGCVLGVLLLFVMSWPVAASSGIYKGALPPSKGAFNFPPLFSEPLPGLRYSRDRVVRVALSQRSHGWSMKDAPNYRRGRFLFRITHLLMSPPLRALKRHDRRRNRIMR